MLLRSVAAAGGEGRSTQVGITLGHYSVACDALVRVAQLSERHAAPNRRALGYKNALNEIEERSPGTKAAFVFGFLERGHELFADEVAEARDELRPCSVCTAPTPGDVCAFCRMRARAVGEPIGVRSTS